MQLALPGLTLPLSRPLVPMEALLTLLDRDEDQVLSEIERGGLGWAWDIRTQGAARREVRVWRDSVMEYMQGVPPRASGSALAVLDTFLPHRDVRLTELQRWFSCSNTHVCNLLRDACLTVAGPRPEHSSVTAVTRITHASVVAFLESRRIL